MTLREYYFKISNVCNKGGKLTLTYLFGFFRSILLFATIVTCNHMDVRKDQIKMV